MFEGCNTKNQKLAKMSVHGEQRVWHYQNVGFCQKKRLYILDILVVVSLYIDFLFEKLKISLAIG